MTPRARLASRTLGAALAAVTVAGCAGGASPAQPPLRPEPPPEEPAAEAPRDCAPAARADLPPAVPYAERSIDEAENLADQGAELLAKADDRSHPLAEREQAIAEAVDRFVTALLADPYNAAATYRLAAAYARIGRRQCALNLLARLVPLGELRSHQDAVDGVVDRLLGRDRHEGRMDPSFFELRDDPGFRRLVKQF